MKKEYVISLTALVVVVIGLTYAFTRESGVSENGKFEAIASFYPMQFFTEEIGGDRISVSNVTPAGAEPHDYEPSAQDIARIESGDLLILNGAVEAWGDRVRGELSGSSVNVIVAGEGLFTRTEESHEEEPEERKEEDEHGGVDPHIWLDPVLAKAEAHAIAEGLIEVDPANASYYRENETTLGAKLNALDTSFRAGLASCRTRDIVTSHTAFAYLADRYDLNQVSITGLSPDEEPSAADLAAVAKFAKDNSVKYIFFETLVSPRLAETVATEVGAEILVLDPIEGLSDDDINAGKDYFTVMEENLENLQIALECT